MFRRTIRSCYYFQSAWCETFKTNFNSMDLLKLWLSLSRKSGLVSCNTVLPTLKTHLLITASSKALYKIELVTLMISSVQMMSGIIEKRVEWYHLKSLLGYGPSAMTIFTHDQKQWSFLHFLSLIEIFFSWFQSLDFSHSLKCFFTLFSSFVLPRT